MCCFINLAVIQMLVGVFVTCLTIIILYYKWCFTYWSKRNIPIFKRPRIPFGTLTSALGNANHIGVECKKVYDILRKDNFKHGGGWLFTTPKYFVTDPEYIKNILQKDFEYFSAREFYYNERDDPLSANLFAINGEKWKTFHRQLSPAFTTMKIKMMFDNILHCSNQMRNAIRKTCENQEVLHVEDITESYTIDVIGSCSFGLECNSFKNPNAEFKEQGRRAFHMYPLRVFKIFLGFFCPEFARLLGVTFFDKQSNHFFLNVVKDTMDYRKTNKIHRKDILQLLIDLRIKQRSQDEDKILTLEEITAQVFVFFAAGFETSFTTLTFCLYELSLNRDVQEKVRKEINEVSRLYGGNITYEVITHMKYLEQVIDETLRKYPPLPYISRRCVEDYTIPDTSIKIEKGIEVIISILGLHHDPKYYPAPEKFIPERFSEEEKHKRTPFTYLPFGEGPRICIGKRLGLLQTKVGLVALLKHFKFSLNEKTRTPLEMEPFSFNLMAKSGVFLNVSTVKDNDR